VTDNRDIRRVILGVVERIRREYRLKRIVLFGSYANGNPGPDSDIDLLIVKDTAERPIDRRVAVARIAADPNRLIPVQPPVLTPGEVESRLAVGTSFCRTSSRAANHSSPRVCGFGQAGTRESETLT
jgi:hypothetical protein